MFKQILYCKMCSLLHFNYCILSICLWAFKITKLAICLKKKKFERHRPWNKTCWRSDRSR